MHGRLQPKKPKLRKLSGDSNHNRTKLSTKISNKQKTTNNCRIGNNNTEEIDDLYINKNDKFEIQINQNSDSRGKSLICLVN